MARRRKSFKIAPGVRVSASSRGVRTSIGNNSARVSFGSGPSYASAKVAGVRVSQRGSSAGLKKSPGGSKRPSVEGQRPPTVAELERTQRRSALEDEIEELTRIENALVTQHHEHYEPAARIMVPAPQVTDVETLSAAREVEALQGISIFRRSARKLARAEATKAALIEAQRIDSSNQALHLERQAESDKAWELLRAHDPEAVRGAFEVAFRGGATRATCVEAGSEGSKPYANVILVVGSVTDIPEKKPAVTPAGKPTTKKRTKTERNALHVEALGSTVLSVVRRSFAVVPTLETLRIAVLRHDRSDVVGEDMAAIYFARFERNDANRIQWMQVRSDEALVVAGDAQLERRGAVREVVPIVVGHEGMRRAIERFGKGELSR